MDIYYLTVSFTGICIQEGEANYLLSILPSNICSLLKAPTDDVAYLLI